MNVGAPITTRLTRRARVAASRGAGFTMIEMIVTLTIFALLTALAVPTFSVWMRNTRVRAVADALQTGVRLAQSESLRRSRQVVFFLTTSTAPQTSPTSVANGPYWAIYTIPSMNGETAQFIQAGVLASTSSNVNITTTGQGSLCFNSVGRLNANSGVGTYVSNATCTLPGGTPAVQAYNIAVPNPVSGQDRSLRVNVALGGQVHMCDPAKTLSAANPDGCP